MILYNLSFTFKDAVYKKNAKVYDELAERSSRTSTRRRWPS